MHKNSKLLITLLILITAFLGYKIVGESQSPTASLTENRIYPKRLTEDEIRVINPPVNGTYEERKLHIELTQKLAQETQKLTIKECFGDPTVVSVAERQNLEIKNTDSAARAIAFNKDHVFMIPPNQTVSVKAEFGFGPGVYGYSCDAIEGAAGMVLIESLP